MPELSVRLRGRSDHDPGTNERVPHQSAGKTSPSTFRDRLCPAKHSISCIRSLSAMKRDLPPQKVKVEDISHNLAVEDVKSALFLRDFFALASSGIPLLWHSFALTSLRSDMLALTSIALTSLCSDIRLAWHPFGLTSLCFDIFCDILKTRTTNAESEYAATCCKHLQRFPRSFWLLYSALPLSDSYALAGCAGAKAGQEETGDSNSLEQTR